MAPRESLVGSDAVLNACRRSALRTKASGPRSSPRVRGLSRDTKSLGSSPTRSQHGRAENHSLRRRRSVFWRESRSGCERQRLRNGRARDNDERARRAGEDRVEPDAERLVAGQSDSIVNAIRMRLDEAGHRVSGVPVVYEDLDGGSEERGSWDAAREQANARYAAAQADGLAYIGTLDTDAAPYSIPITNAAGPADDLAVQYLPRADQAIRPGEPDKHYPTGGATTCDRADRRPAGRVRSAVGGRARRTAARSSCTTRSRAVAASRCRSPTHAGDSASSSSGPPVGIEPKQSEYEALAQTIADSGADLVFYGGIIQNGAGPLWRDIRTAAPAITMMGPDTLFEQPSSSDAGAHAEGTLVTFGGVPPALLEGKGRAFYERYVERFGRRARVLRSLRLRRDRGDPAGDRAVGRADRAAITQAAFATATSTACSAAGASTRMETSTCAAARGSPFERALRAASSPRRRGGGPS